MYNHLSDGNRRDSLEQDLAERLTRESPRTSSDELQLAALLGKTLLEKNAELEKKLRKLQDFAEEAASEKKVLSRQLAEVKDSLQFSNRTCEQLESRAEEVEKTNTALTKLYESQATQLEQKTTRLQDQEEKLESLQKECQQMKEEHSELGVNPCHSCSNGSKLMRKKATSGGRETPEDFIDHPPIEDSNDEDVKKTLKELREKLRTVSYQKQKYEKGLREVMIENQTLSRQLEKAEGDASELQARLRAFEDAMERQSLERSCSSPLVHSGHYQHLSVSSTPTYNSVFQYSGALPSSSGGEDTSTQPSLKTSRTTDSLLGTSLFSELDSQYSDLQEHYDELLKECTCSAGLAHRNRLKLSTECTSGADGLGSLVASSPRTGSLSGQPFKDLFEEVFATLKQSAAVADKLVQRKKPCAA